jgi:predicted lipoprotein
MRRIAITAGVFLAVAGLIWKFPLLHVVPLEQDTTQKKEAVFIAKGTAEELWRTQIVPRLADAHDAATVLAALEADPQQARSKFGRTVGIGRATYFLLHGEGAIVSVEKNRIGVSLREGSGEPNLLITIGPVFGNAVRDASGAISAGEFSRSQDFNELAAELNLLVENRVGKRLAEQARVGAKVRFVGCVEVPGDKLTKLVKLIPLEAMVQ